MKSVIRLMLLSSLSFGVGQVQAASDLGYGAVRYGKGLSFSTGVFSPILIGYLANPGKEPFLIFTGRGCTECDAGTNIYIHSPSNGEMKGSEQDPRHLIPGDFYHYETRELIERVWFFWGRCLADQSEAAVWLHSAKVANGGWEQHVVVASQKDNKLNVKVDPIRVPTLVALRRAVSLGACNELGRKKHIYTEP